MTTSNKGKQLIKDAEGLQLKAYRCPAGVPTIGWGHTKGVKMGQQITEEQAEDMLIEDIAPIERFLNGLNTDFRQGQFDALVSWIFNLGIGRFKGSTIYRLILGHARDEEITDQLVKWTYSGKQQLSGLMKRRVAEANLFLGHERYKVSNGKMIKI